MQETAKLVIAAGGQADVVSGDVADVAVTTRLVETCLTKYGAVDILVNNAGFARPGPVPSLTPDDWRRVFEVNFFAPLELIYMVLPSFLERKEGKIVNISSVAGKVAFPGSVCYAATKFALTGMSEGMASELGLRGIDVITVCPGLIRTEFFKNNNNPADITEMAEQPGVSGWLIKNIMSISSEAAAQEIIRACEQGGCREIVLTGPGKFVERLAGICPPAAFALSKLIPADHRPQSADK